MYDDHTIDLDGTTCPCAETFAVWRPALVAYIDTGAHLDHDPTWALLCEHVIADMRDALDREPCGGAHRWSVSPMRTVYIRRDDGLDAWPVRVGGEWHWRVTRDNGAPIARTATARHLCRAIAALVAA